MILFFLLTTIFICFFILFVLSRNDFVLLRQNISLAQIFDLAAMTFFVSLVLGRLFFIINNSSFELFQIFRFFHLFKFPGISPFGTFLGGTLAILIFFRKKKGMARIFDIFTISFLPLFYFLIVFMPVKLNLIFLPLVTIFALVFFIFFIRSHNRYILKDGSISYIFLLLIAVTSFTYDFFFLKNNFLFDFSFVQIISIPIVVYSLIFYFLNQKSSHG